MNNKKDRTMGKWKGICMHCDACSIPGDSSKQSLPCTPSFERPTCKPTPIFPLLGCQLHLNESVAGMWQNAQCC